MFVQYKNMLDDWEEYLIKVYLKDPNAYFTAAMANNTILNFTNYIEDDMKTFLLAVHGSQLSPTNLSLPIWKDTAQKLFKNKFDSNVESNRGPYDKLIMDCALRKNLLKKAYFDSTQVGCDLFLPTLTTNGLCYTFNGKATSEIWDKSEVVETFQQLFPMKHTNEYFAGAGIFQGKFNQNLLTIECRCLL